MSAARNWRSQLIRAALGRRKVGRDCHAGAGAVFDDDEPIVLVAREYAAAMVLRFTPRSAATWRTGGSGAPSANLPRAISSLMPSATWLGIDRSRVGGAQDR